MYAKIIAKSCHNRGKIKYHEVTRYIKTKNFDTFFRDYRKLSGIKKNSDALLQFKVITKAEYYEGLKKQKKDFYINYNRDNTYRREVMFA